MPPCPQATCRGFCFSCLLGPPPSSQSMAPTAHRAAHSVSQGTALPSWHLNLGGTRPATRLARPRHLHLALRSPWPQLIFAGFWPSGLSPLAVLPRESVTNGGSPAGSLSGPPLSLGSRHTQDSLLSCCGAPPCPSRTCRLLRPPAGRAPPPVSPPVSAASSLRCSALSSPR